MSETNEVESSESVDLQECKFGKFLDEVRLYLEPGFEDISKEELEAELIKLFKESREVRGTTDYEQRLRDVMYFFNGWLVLHPGHNEKKVNEFCWQLDRVLLEQFKSDLEKMIKGKDPKVLAFRNK